MYQQPIKKGIIITIIGFLLLSSMGSSIAAIYTENDQKESLSFPYDTSHNLSNSAEFVDQRNNGNCGCGTNIQIGTFSLTDGNVIAQSFIPSHAILSKVSLKLSESIDAPNTKITLSIKASLDGPDLGSIEEPAQEGTVFFDFEDIEVIPGNTYYIICSLSNTTSLDNGFGWLYTKDDLYRKGTAWISTNSQNWLNSEGDDMFFETYWRDYSPEKPVIEGISQGKAQKRYDYHFTTTDPENDDIYYYIEWGDGRTWNWIGPFSSDEQVTKSHQWAREGEYTIRVKAKDEYGVESDWSDPFTISMPKNKNNYFPILDLLWSLLNNPHHLFSMFIG